jgi:hypothetical protein
MNEIAIFSQHNDFHGRVIHAALERRSDVSAHYISTDAMLNGGHLTWRNDEPSNAVIGDHNGRPVDIDSLQVIWWRRINQPQLAIDILPDEVSRDLVDHEWRAALMGTVTDRFRGTWVNDPLRDTLAGNKIFQLKAATSAGFRTPRTLVSQQPDVIREFCRELNGEVVIKKLLGTVHRPMATVKLCSGDLDDDEAVRLCPSIYQELVVTRRHLRVCCFGDVVSAVLITTDVLDWRRDLSVPFQPFEIDHDTKLKLSALIQSLGLRMGIMDMMIDEADNLVWLELNTQGQFLFSEGKSGIDLTNMFADFLIQESQRKT